MRMEVGIQIIKKIAAILKINYMNNSCEYYIENEVRICACIVRSHPFDRKVFLTAK